MAAAVGGQKWNPTGPFPLRVPPQGQEVGALEGDDFLWDSHASGLC